MHDDSQQVSFVLSVCFYTAMACQRVFYRCVLILRGLMTVRCLKAVVRPPPAIAFSSSAWQCTSEDTTTSTHHTLNTRMTSAIRQHR